MKVDTYNQNGEKIGQTLLPKEVFEIPMNHDLVHQVAVSQAANRRRIIASTKDRSEVRGGGKKPWRQKGTGRARHGSITSPIWRHGGVTFGPNTDTIFKKNIAKKMRRKALFMVLTAKAQKELLIVLDDLKIEKPKTKLMNDILEKLPGKGSTRLVILPEKDESIIKSTRNIPKTSIELAKNINVLQLLSFKYLVLPKDSIKAIKETFSKKE